MPREPGARVLRIAVFGGRDFTDREALERALDTLLAKRGRFVLVHGACPRGVDTLAEQWAESRGLTLEPHPAWWDMHGAAAGPIRNKAMARSGLDGAVAFPGGAGTTDMLEQCERVGVPVWRPITTQRRDR